jgi:hypothetical protein
MVKYLRLVFLQVEVGDLQNIRFLLMVKNIHQKLDQIVIVKIFQK